MVELAKVVRPFGGFYISHERSEGKDPMWKVAPRIPTPSVDLLAAVEETIAIGRDAACRLSASHLKAKGANYWGSSHAATRLIHDARAEGVEVYADQYPYDTSGSDGSTVLIPSWALAPPDDAAVSSVKRKAAPGDVTTISARLAAPADAARIRGDIDHEIARRGGAVRIVIYDHPEKKYVEKSLADIASDLGKTPADAAIHLQLTGYDRRGRRADARLLALGDRHRAHHAARTSPRPARTAIRSRTATACRMRGSTARCPARSAATSSIAGSSALPFAIRSMTSLAAQIMGLKDRGLIRPGAWADIVIFDLAEIADNATFTKPHQYPTGIPYVLVNGVSVVDRGKFTNATPGKVLTPASDGSRTQARP